MTDKDFSKHLIVIDMQNDFITGALANLDAKAIVPKVIEKVDAARKAGDVQISWTKDTHHKDYLETQEGKKLPIVHCLDGTWGHDLADGLEIKEDEGEFWKGTFGSWFLANDFHHAVKQMRADNGYDDNKIPGAKGRGMEIEICGICTDICVISNAMLLKAALPEARIIVDASCCAGTTPESHRCALEAMKACQIEVVGAEKDIIAAPEITD